ncbi:MAG: two-component system, NarL family, response regulator DesR [Solirubrobacteraceae bacterium]|nr:two-component system, NarL family, response regulator DesR [Solirubrobacteraceae bacterium]
MVRGALASLLTLEPDIEVVAEVARGDEVLAAVQRTQSDVALLDIEMPGATGVEAAEDARSVYRRSSTGSARKGSPLPPGDWPMTSTRLSCTS